MIAMWCSIMVGGERLKYDPTPCLKPADGWSGLLRRRRDFSRPARMSKFRVRTSSATVRSQRMLALYEHGGKVLAAGDHAYKLADAAEVHRVSEAKSPAGQACPDGALDAHCY